MTHNRILGAEITQSGNCPATAGDGVREQHSQLARYFDYFAAFFCSASIIASSRPVIGAIR